MSEVVPVRVPYTANGTKARGSRVAASNTRPVTVSWADAQKGNSQAMERRVGRMGDMTGNSG